MNVFLSSQKETDQSVQSCCSNMFSLWVLLLDSAVGRPVFCAGVTEVARFQMKSENAACSGQEAAPGALGSPQIQ